MMASLTVSVDGNTYDLDLDPNHLTREELRWFAALVDGDELVELEKTGKISTDPEVVAAFLFAKVRSHVPDLDPAQVSFFTEDEVAS